MTPAQLTELAALLLDFRDWMDGYSHDAPFDMEVVNHVVDVIALYRRMLVEDGAE